jgi:hypothetical protein
MIAPLMRRSCGIAALLAACLLPRLQADDGGRAQTAAAYLWLGTSARALAMGNSFVALADDAAAAVYNPAGLAQTPVTAFSSAIDPAALDEYVQSFDRIYRHDALVSSSILGMDRTHNVFGYSFSCATRKNRKLLWWRDPGYYGTANGLGITLSTFGIRAIDGYDIFGNRQDSFSNSENTAILSYAHGFTRTLFAGISAKRYTQNISNARAAGWGVDAGFLWHCTTALAAGLSVRNLGGQLQWKIADDFTGTADEYSERVAVQTLAGAAYKASPKLLLVLNVDATAHQALTVHAGGEYRLSGTGVARVGLDGTNPTLGFGLAVPWHTTTLALDYAYRYDLEKFSPVHQFSVSTRIRPSLDPMDW